MDNPEKLATQGTQDEEKDNTLCVVKQLFKFFKNNLKKSSRSQRIYHKTQKLVSSSCKGEPIIKIN